MAKQLRLAVSAAYDRTFGLELEQLAVDGCITKGALRRPGRRAQPGGPSQAGPERSL